jgi:hypothetical protein
VTQTRVMGHQALDGWLKLARLPIDTLTRLLPNGDTGPRNAAMLIVDRVDATVRDTIGGLLGSDALRQDAHRRRIAADERERAMELRAEAAAKSRQADARLRARHDTVAQQRAKAEQLAQDRLDDVSQMRADRQHQLEETAAKQKRAIEQDRQQKRASADKRARRQRLDVLDDQADALDQQSDALTARDEAQRLRRAASAAKTTRKRA